MNIAKERLIQERKVKSFPNLQTWRKEHPFGFIAKPMTSEDGETQDLFRWECKIPGKKGVSFLIVALVALGRRGVQVDDGVF